MAVIDLYETPSGEIKSPTPPAMLSPQDALKQLRYTLERLQKRGGSIHPLEVQGLLDVLPIVEREVL